MGDMHDEVLRVLARRVRTLALAMEKMKLAEYVNLLERPWRLMYVNFLAGLARGVGTAVGFTLLAALVVYILRWLVMLHLPGISGFIAEIVRMVQLRLGY
ncbi:MAG: DUF5665 domain-containing protein [Desulfotomaculales bacterium]